MKPDFTVILPTYNERESVPELISAVLALESECEIRILVVDDDSPDGTADLLETLFGSNPRVSVLNRKGLPRGLVNSLRDAIKVSCTEYLIFMDADLQMPAAPILDFIKIVVEENPTAVIGSRFIPGGSDVRDTGQGFSLQTFHKILSRFLNVLVPGFLSLPFTDISSGFIAIERSFFERYSLKGKHGEYFMELLYALKSCHCVEVPYELQPREKGQSKTSEGNLWIMMKTGLLYLRMALRLYFSEKWSKH